MKGYKLKGKAKIKKIEADYPQDKQQVPDIICTMQAQRFLGGVWNVGYFRVPVTKLRNDNVPQWYTFKSLENPHTSPGKMLCNFYLISGKEMPKTNINKTNVKTTYTLSYHLYYSLDISPNEVNEDKIESAVALTIGSKHIYPSKAITIENFPDVSEKKYIPTWNIKGKTF